jgi:hypothetical protein
MIQFKSTADLQQLPSDNPAYPVVSQLVHSLITSYIAEGYSYDPDADGWVVLIEEGDQDRPLEKIWEGDNTRLADLWWEGFTLQDGCFVGVYLANNQWGLAVVIPDEPWITGKLRETIEAHLDP